jgi:hypothetical protein
MEIFCRNKIILVILTFPLTDIKIIFTHLINHLLSVHLTSALSVSFFIQIGRMYSSIKKKAYK